MRWEKNKSKKIVKRFLIIPTTIGGETRWLEWAYIEKFYNDYYLNPWKNSRWADWVNEK